ncbi:MAG: class I SAM-dependent methyltransferase [Dehalococcoidia bacterium]
MTSPDFGKTATDYATHRQGFPAALFDRLATFGIGIRGQRVLDLGTGTGTVARSLALRGSEVTGLDPSAEMMGQAKAMDAAAGIAVRYIQGKAEATGLGDAAFDVVTAGQCWHWFDGPVAAREVYRLLSPGGILAILHFDWLPLPGNVVDATERLIQAHNPAWKFGGALGMHPEFSVPVAVAGLAGIETFSYDTPAIYTHEGWRGRIRASAGVAGTLAPDAVASFDAAHARLLHERFPDDPIAVPHRVWALIARKPV